MARLELVRDAAARIADGNARHLMVAAERVAAEARSQAPVRTGTYRDGIAAVPSEVDGHPVGRVVARAWYSVFLEFGTHGKPPRAGLRRAAERVGLKVTRR